MPLSLLLVPLLAAPLPAAQSKLTAIDLYGLRTLEPAQVLEAAGISRDRAAGDTIDAIRERVAALEGVAEAHVAPIRYPGNFVLFIGVREVGQPAAVYREAPEGDVVLDAEVLAAYEESLELLTPAIRAGKAGEDVDGGYSLAEYPPRRAIQETFLPVANERFDELARVLRSSKDPRSRRAAAAVLAYGEDKVKIARELQHAATDPDSGVRNSAVRALSVLARWAQENPQPGLSIDPDPFLRLIESVVWTDRNKGAATLDSLSKARDPKLLEALRKRSLEELEEMARWNSVGHATFSLRILARVAGVSEDELEETEDAVREDEEARLYWVDQLVERAREQ